MFYNTYFETVSQIFSKICFHTSGQLLKQLCLEISRFDVGRSFWVPIRGQLRGIPVFKFATKYECHLVFFPIYTLIKPYAAIQHLTV